MQFKNLYKALNLAQDAQLFMQAKPNAISN